MAGNALESGRTVTSKVTAILMAFASGSDWSLSELARLTNIPLTTTHRLVTELAAAQLLERAPDGGYRVGPALGRLTGGAQGAPTVAQLGPAVLDDLAATVEQPVRLGLLHDLRVSYMEKRTGRAPVTPFRAGAVLPVHASALGKVLLAFAPPATVRAVVGAGLTRYTARTVTRPDRLLHALSVARLTRIATCEGELVVDECAVAAPVVGPGGRVVAALEIRVPDLRGGLDGVRDALTLTARSLSRELAGAASAVPDPALPAPAVVGAAS